MKFKIISLIVLTMSITMQTAQGAIGLKAGVNYIYFKNKDIQSEPAEMWGIFKDFHLSKRFSLAPELLISHKRGKLYNVREAPWWLSSNGIINHINIQIHTVFLEIPVLLQFSLFTKDQFTLNLIAGPSLSIGFSDKSKKTIIRQDKYLTEPENLQYDYKYADYNRFSKYGKCWNFGIELVWRRFSLECRYSNINYDLDMIADLWFKEELMHSLALIGGIRF